MSGKARQVGRSESQKTCLDGWRNLRGRKYAKDLEDKKGKSPDRFISVRGFFFALDPEYQ